jgi:hypothetical protein
LRIDELNAANPGADAATEPIGLHGRVQATVTNRLPRRDRRQPDVTGRLSGRLGIHHRQDIHAFDLSGDLYGETGRIEMRDASHAAASLDRRLPGSLSCIARGRYDSDTSDNDSSH